MTDQATDTQRATFVRKERDHLDVLQRRLDWLREGERPAVPGGFTEVNGYFAGEANALAWALEVVQGTVEPIEVRVERWERQIRLLQQRVARLEDEFTEEEV